MGKTGRLYMVATPIGNLEDMTFRAVQCLKDVDVIACEDTRHSRILLDHYGIETKTTSYHEHNKYEKAAALVEMMNQGKSVAAITDAGTPGISDPGEELVRQAVEAGIEVSALPGASAMITALSMCGLPTRRFVFEGFIPIDKKERKDILERIRLEQRTVVIYEAPHRLKRTLGELGEIIGGRNICICRELTKKYEEALRLTVLDAVRYFEENEPKGEMVIIIEGMSEEEHREHKAKQWEDLTLEEHLQMYLCQGMSEKDAMKAVAKDRAMNKRDVYDAIKVHK